MNPIKILLAGLGFLCVGIGVLGIFIPVLPTVPMFILAAFLFERSSDRLHKWFKGTKLYDRYLKNFMEHRSMTLRGKLTILIPVTILLIVTGAIVNNWIAWIILVVLIVIMQIYFWTRIKTVSPEEKAAETVEKVEAAEVVERVETAEVVEAAEAVERVEAAGGAEHTELEPSEDKPSAKTSQ